MLCNWKIEHFFTLNRLSYVTLAQPSLAIPPYHPLLSTDPQGYIAYRHRAAVRRIELDILPFLVHVKGSTWAHHLWARPYFSSSVPRVINTQLAKAWIAIDKLSVIWKSDLTDKMKRSFFQAAIGSILLYGCTTWTLTKWTEKNLDGNYTKMLWAILNKSWRQHPTKKQLYGHIPPIYIYIYIYIYMLRTILNKFLKPHQTNKLCGTLLEKNELISDVLLWNPLHRSASVGWSTRT